MTKPGQSPETPGSDDLLDGFDVKAQLAHGHDLLSLSIIADIDIPDKPPVVPLILAPRILKDIDVGGAEVRMLEDGIEALHANVKGSTAA